MGIAALVLGIISLIFAFIPFTGVVGIVIGIVGIIVGVQGKKVPETKALATAGLICSIIGTVLSLLVFVACAACAGAMSLL